MTRAAHTPTGVRARGHGDAERSPWHSVDDLVAWLHTMPPLDRARVAALLVDEATVHAVGQVRRAAVYQLTRSMTYAETADLLGTSTSAVNNAVTAHRRDHR
jgi:DNA-directed RNA polymerase specialized sigma24 family protein